MFGEESLFFVTTVKLDGKNRMSIPAKTKVEPHESIVLYDNEDYVSIYSSEYIKKMFDELDKARLKELSKNNPHLALKLNYQIKYYNLFILDRIKVDGQRRIILSKKIKDRFNYGSRVILQGEYNHVNMFNSEEAFEQYKVKIKEKRS